MTASLDAPREARSAVRGIDGLDEATKARAVAVISELVSALVEHGEHDLVVRVLRGETLIRAEALSDGAVEAYPDARTLSALTVRWGVRRRDPVVVWAEIRPA